MEDLLHVFVCMCVAKDQHTMSWVAMVMSLLWFKQFVSLTQSSAVVGKLWVIIFSSNRKTFKSSKFHIPIIWASMKNGHHSYLILCHMLCKGMQNFLQFFLARIKVCVTVLNTTL